MARSDRCTDRRAERGVLLMSNHQNEEILESLYDEEYHRLETKYPQWDEPLVSTVANYFAKKRWEDME